MRKEDKDLFIKGLKKAISAQGHNQTTFAKHIGVRSVTVSRWLSPNTKDFPSEDSLEKISTGLAMTEDEIIALTLPPRPTLPTAPNKLPAPLPADYMSVDAVVQTLSAVSASFIKADARLEFWKQLLESLPIPVMVVRDSVVYIQNRASRALKIGVGKPLCEWCLDPKCRENGRCDIEESLITGRDISRYKRIGDNYYNIVTGHFSANNNSYNVVMLTEINECFFDSERLKTIQEERIFLSNNLFETPEIYFNTHGRISYINESFAKLFEIGKDDLLTSDDLIIMLSRKLFYFGHVSQAIEDARDDGKPIEIQAKLKNNKVVYFILTPHMAGEEIRGVLVVVLTAELYACLKEIAS